MTNNGKGWLLFLGALGMMFSLLAMDVSELQSFNDVWTPKFIASMMAHLGTVIAAFIGGKLIPTEDK